MKKTVNEKAKKNNRTQLKTNGRKKEGDIGKTQHSKSALKISRRRNVGVERRRKHDQSLSDESRGWQACGEGISHHFVRAQRHEFEEAIQYDFTHKVLTNVNMTGELSAHRIFAHRNTNEVVFVQKSGFSFRKSKIG